MTPPVPRLFVFLAFLCLAPAARAADTAPTPLPDGGEALAAPEKFVRSSSPELLGIEREGAGEHAGRPVWRADVRAGATDPWLAQIKAALDRPVRKGDTALLVLQARAIETSHESDQAQLRLVVADIAKPFPRIATGHYFADREWREFALPFVFGKNYAPGEVAAMIDLGFGRQSIELAGLTFVNFGSSVPLAALPRTRPTYRGHAADAPWRSEALARIERIRKGDLTVELVDAAGAPVADADVRLTLRSHAFQFGVAVNVDTFTLESPDRETYRRRVFELFNAASLENGLKWANWIGEKKPADYRARTLETLDALRDGGLALRGHVMVWPGRRFLPDSILAKLDGPERDEVPAITLAHIRDIGEAMRGRVTEWDVLNEPVTNHALMDAFGRGVMIDWFREAARVAPGTPLFLNDWGNHDLRQSPAHFRDFQAVARELIDGGAPLGGLGLQCHVGGVLSPPEDILASLDAHRDAFGLPIRVTEFDVTMDDEELQADYTRDFFIAMFSHPSVIGVQQWGFWAGRHWQTKAALYTKDWKERPNGAAYRKLVKETWRTDERGRTDAVGRWSARGFFGDYDLIVTVGGREHRLILRHAAGAPGPIRVSLPSGS